MGVEADVLCWAAGPALARHAGLKEPFLPPDGVCSSATQSCAMRGANYLPAEPSVGRFLMNPPSTPPPWLLLALCQLSGHRRNQLTMAQESVSPSLVRGGTAVAHIASESPSGSERPVTAHAISPINSFQACPALSLLPGSSCWPLAKEPQPS